MIALWGILAMNDAMNIQKVFAPIPSAQRVRRLKRESPDSDKRRFERDFNEEKEGEKGEKGETEGPSASPSAKAEGENPRMGSAGSDPGATDPTGDETVGVLLDIRV